MMEKINLSKFDATKRASAPRRGFTLIELLVVLTMMVSLGGMLTYALASAATDARMKRTQADVITIAQLLQSRVNEVSLSQLSLVYGRSGLELARQGKFTPGGEAIGGYGTQNVVNSASPSTAQLVSFAANERARLVLLARRDMSRMVLPECQADLFYPPASLQFRTIGGSGWYPNVAQLKPPAQWSRMRTLVGLLSAADIDATFTGTNGTVLNATSPASNPEFDAIAAAGLPGFAAILKQNSTTGAQTRWTREHESAECLYLILATTELFGQSAIDKVSSTQIEDTDQDGVPEILDSWGRPYEFIRNPIGFSNPAIKNFVPGGATPADQFPFDPDPFDFLAADLRYDAGTHPSVAGIPETAYFPIYLPPMVISAGQDGEFGIRRSYVDDDDDGQIDVGADGFFGVNQGYSSSAVQYPTNGNGRFRPFYPGTPSSVWYPDPFFNVGSVDPNSSDFYIFSIDGIVEAKTGGVTNPVANGGMGEILDRDQYADNITSLDSDI